ncbi:MAG TPA: ABC transporter permease, partial [Patescibacteria group bacterium]|nr:ABC transporter permease [Patescibacteria group bacterium]
LNVKIQNGYIHLFKTALEDFKRNKVRTALTSLGIMIGVLSVVLLIALGLGLKNYIEGQFESMGANLILILPGSGFTGEGGGSFGGAGTVGGVSFDEQDVRSLERIAEIDYVVPVFMKGTSIEGGGEKKYGYVMGMNDDGFKLMNLEAEEGELFKKSDIQASSKVGVLGNVVAENLFDTPKNAVGKTVRFEDQRFKVIGVAEKKGDQEADNAFFIPYRTTYGNLNPDKTFWSIYLGVKSDDMVSLAKTKAENVLLKRYDKDDFAVTEQSELLNTINQIFSILNTILIAIGSISLLVGGIGIMNIMFATVTERTKEVGIRRAVGATENDILKQFLTESVLLSLFGGLLGLLFASLIVFGIRFFFPAAISVFAVLISLVVSSAIGIFFGVFPARRAAKLPPIEAIRYE